MGGPGYIGMGCGALRAVVWWINGDLLISPKGHGG